MIYAVWLPLFVPLLATPVARCIADRLPPRTAAWTLATCAGALAVCSAAALGLLALSAILQLGPVAALEALSPHRLIGQSGLTVPAGSLAAVLLLVQAVRTRRTAARHRREVSTAQHAGAEEELTVRPDDFPYAYALPGRRLGNLGTIVVSTAMLRTLQPREREVLFAHERSHLSGRHHLFLAATDLAATLHPALRGMQAPLAYSLERWADESAAHAVGDRRLAARAIGRAALAAQASRKEAAVPRGVLAATGNTVPRRVAALLRAGQAVPRGRAGRTWAPVAVLLLGCLALSAASAADAAEDLHGDVKVTRSASQAH